MLNKFCNLIGILPEGHTHIFKSVLEAIKNADLNLAAFHLMTGLNAHNTRELQPYDIYRWLVGIYYLKNDTKKALKYAMLARSISTKNVKLEFLYQKLLTSN